METGHESVFDAQHRPTSMETGHESAVGTRHRSTIMETGHESAIDIRHRPTSVETGHESAFDAQNRPTSMETDHVPAINTQYRTNNMETGHESAYDKQYKSTSMETGHESAFDTQSCAEGIQVMRLEHAKMETGHDEESVHSAAANPRTENAAGELNTTMNHIIDTTAYPFHSEPDDDQLNASIMIDPSNPFDDKMIEKLLSKLAQPLSSYENYRRVNANVPRICVRSSIELGRFHAVISKICFVQCCANIQNFESNQIGTSVFDSKQVQLFEIFEYLPSPVSYFGMKKHYSHSNSFVHLFNS